MRSKITLARLIRLYRKHENVAEVARKVGRSYAAVHQRLKKAKVL